MNANITLQMLQRLPKYLNYLTALPPEGAANISATAIAEALKLNDVQVRKDLASVSDGGKPKVGYVTQNLINDIKEILGYNNSHDAIIVGVGSLGHALLSYEGFSKYGLNIVAGFDTDEKIIGTEVGGKMILPVTKLENLCERMRIRIGIIAVPAGAAQSVCDTLVQSGVLAIWNFAPVHLNTGEGILVQDENMAASLALLSRHLTEKISG
ncbi:MAG TPA: redox-sensing transcriptional repressor Rex [Syntrophomonas sp.]|nr:redox-sensing transcriptional repressor Rex [Syntrophomonas sp.]